MFQKFFFKTPWRSFLNVFFMKKLKRDDESFFSLFFRVEAFIHVFFIKAFIWAFQALDFLFHLLIKQTFQCKNSSVLKQNHLNHETYAKLYPSIPMLSFSYFRMVASESLLALACLVSCWGGAAKTVAITKANTIKNFIFFYFSNWPALSNVQNCTDW